MEPPWSKTMEGYFSLAKYVLNKEVISFISRFFHKFTISWAERAWIFFFFSSRKLFQGSTLYQYRKEEFCFVRKACMKNAVSWPLEAEKKVFLHEDYG